MYRWEKPDQPTFSQDEQTLTLCLQIGRRIQFITAQQAEW